MAEVLAVSDQRWTWQCCLAIAIGCGLYGWTVGLWRSPVQSVFTAMKFPLLVFLTCGGNALLNGMLAILLGSGLSFRQTTVAILMSFTIAAIVLAAVSPVSLFVLYNTPPLAAGTASTGHSITMLLHVGIIAYAGVLANSRLFQMLRYFNPATAGRVLVCWLAGNLLLGAQLSWVLRPFIGSPHLAVQFFRDEPLRGNFYEAVFQALRQLLS